MVLLRSRVLVMVLCKAMVRIVVVVCGAEVQLSRSGVGSLRSYGGTG